MALRPDALAYPPRGMSREMAARYVGISSTKFDQLILDRRMPKPRQIDGRTVWDRVELDMAFSELPHQGHVNFFDRKADDTAANTGTGGEGTGDRRRHAGGDAQGR